ncbi:MAG TPA: helix-turn-helix domain-containing protein [Abditibacteriaceae bacterium]|jgi:transcriptional regulator with XRE-family HTH domain
MTPAAKARQSAGLTIEQAAKRARIGVEYLRRLERHGGASYVLARRLARLYGGCNIMTFL